MEKVFAFDPEFEQTDLNWVCKEEEAKLAYLALAAAQSVYHRHPHDPHHSRFGHLDERLRLDVDAEWSSFSERASDRTSVKTQGETPLVKPYAKRRLAAFYASFCIVSLLLLGFSVWQLFGFLQGRTTLFSAPASVVLLVGSLGLTFEFYMGFKADLAARKGKHIWWTHKNPSVGF
jgi:hypothetical protein